MTWSNEHCEATQQDFLSAAYSLSKSKKIFFTTFQVYFNDSTKIVLASGQAFGKENFDNAIKESVDELNVDLEITGTGNISNWNLLLNNSGFFFEISLLFGHIQYY